MLYEDFETEASRKNLTTVFSKVNKPFCLLGGWAVYLTVNKNYKKIHGRNYHGSRDIDLGFHFSGKESPDELINSALNQSIVALKKIGFKSAGFRLIQQCSRDTGEIASPEQIKNMQPHDILDLYVDLIVDHIPANIHDVLGITPVDEILLETVFTDGDRVFADEFDGNVFLPTPAILLATKLISVPRRDIEHKKWKDIADIYALLWHSGIQLDDLKTNVLKFISEDEINRSFLGINDVDYDRIATAIEIDVAEIKNTITGFIRA